jgi:Family of unknown function (DUF6152)
MEMPGETEAIPIVNKTIPILALAVCLVSPSLPLFAHHGSAAFDTTKTLTLKGTVTRWTWANPHCLLLFDVKGDDGRVLRWIGETQSPDTMVNGGWSETSINSGDEVTVALSPAKNGLPIGLVLTVLLPDGETLDASAGISGYKRSLPSQPQISPQEQSPPAPPPQVSGQTIQSGSISGKVGFVDADVTTGSETWTDADVKTAAMDVLVHLYPSEESPDAKDAGTTRTDANGVYAFASLEPGSYNIFVDGFVANYFVGSQVGVDPIQVGAGQTISGIDFRLLSPRCSRPTPGNRTFAISGKLTETLNGSGGSLPLGHPFWITVLVSGQGIAMPPFGPGRTFDPTRRCDALIGSDGKFTIHGLHAADYTIVVKRAKQNAGSASPTDPVYIGYATVRLLDRDAQVDIPIDETGEITGKVVRTDPDADDSFGPPFSVSVESQQLNIHSGALTDGDGNFRLAGLPVGPTYTLNAGATGKIGSQLFYLQMAECDGQKYSAPEVTIPAGKPVVNCTLTLASRPQCGP